MRGSGFLQLLCCINRHFQYKVHPFSIENHRFSDCSPCSRVSQTRVLSVTTYHFSIDESSLSIEESSLSLAECSCLYKVHLQEQDACISHVLDHGLALARAVSQNHRFSRKKPSFSREEPPFPIEESSFSHFHIFTFKKPDESGTPLSQRAARSARSV